MTDLIAEYEAAQEILMHYRHPGCPKPSNAWWSISGGRDDRDYYCPNCGQRLSPAQYETDPPPTALPAKELDL